MTDYERIKKAIEFIRSNFQQQPELDAVAKEVYLSPFYQSLFFAKTPTGQKFLFLYNYYDSTSPVTCSNFTCDIKPPLFIDRGELSSSYKKSNAQVK